ncbi:MAG: redoxin domain-containing protein [Gemmatimonadota bacterium]
MTDLQNNPSSGPTARPRVRTVVLALAILAVVGIVALLAFNAGEPLGVEVGDRVPAYSAPSLDGGEVSLADHLGEVVLVNVWATWCGPCRVEMASIQALYDTYRDRGFNVLAISVDAGSDSRQVVEKFAAEYELSFTILLDRDSRITRLLRTVGVPETFVLDREGRIAKRVIGASDWSSEANRTLINELLKL